MSPFELIPNRRRPGAVSTLTLSLLLGAMPLASGALAAEPATDATPMGMRVSTKPEAALAVDIEPVRERYDVDEPIRFRVRGETPFYVYLYSLDNENGESTLIFPNHWEQDNYYPGGRSYLIPNRDAEFYGERPGTERVVMVASRRPLEMSRAQLESEEQVALKPAEFDGLLSAQGIRVEHDDHDRVRDGRTDDTLVKQIALEVVGEPLKSRTPDAAPTALIGTAREEYRVGESFDVFFGADHDGWIHLYAVEPGGAYDRLVREEVRASALKSVAFRAEAPYGPHKLIAIYSPEKYLDRSAEARILGDGDRIWAPEDGELAVSVHRIRVIR